MNELDLAIAKIEGLEICQLHDGNLVVETENGRRRFYSPSSRWDDCGPLIEKYKITVGYHSLPNHDEWRAKINDGGVLSISKGKTPQEAICRAIIEISG